MVGFFQCHGFFLGRNHLFDVPFLSEPYCKWHTHRNHRLNKVCSERNWFYGLISDVSIHTWFALFVEPSNSFSCSSLETLVVWHLILQLSGTNMNHRFGRRAHTLPSQLSQNNNYNGHKRANQRSLGPICFLTQEYFKIIVWNFHYIMGGPMHTTNQNQDNQDSGHSPDQSFFFQNRNHGTGHQDVLSMETPRMFRNWVQESTFEQTFGKSWKAPRSMSWDTQKPSKTQ